MSHATNEQQNLATELGYTNERSINWGDRFSKGNRLVWPTRSEWQTADYIKVGSHPRSTNHQKFTHLEDALKSPLSDPT